MKRDNNTSKDLQNTTQEMNGHIFAGIDFVPNELLVQHCEFSFHFICCLRKIEDFSCSALADIIKKKEKEEKSK